MPEFGLYLFMKREGGAGECVKTYNNVYIFKITK